MQTVRPDTAADGRTRGSADAGDGCAQLLSTLLLPVMRERVTALGIELAGAYEFYRSRLASGRVFSDYELRLARAIRGCLPGICEIHEIGCGWGQLIFLLAWHGYRATGFEIDENRFLGAGHLRGFLSRVDPERTHRATIRHEFFPPLDRPEQPTHSLVVATNVVTSSPRFVEEQMIWALRRYRFAIIDVDRFCRLRRAEERPALIGSLEQTGLRNLGLFCDAGAEGQFYLFQRPDLDDARPAGG